MNGIEQLESKSELFYLVKLCICLDSDKKSIDEAKSTEGFDVIMFSGN